VDDLLVFGRQCLDTFSHEHRLFAQFDGLVRQGSVVGQIAGVFLKFILIPRAGRGSRPETISPKDIAVTIQQNRAKPGEKLAAPIVAAQTLPRFHQRVLRQVFGQREVATKRDGLPQQPGSVDATNLTERFGVACPGLVEKTPRLWDFGFHERWTQTEHISIIAEKRGQFHRGTVRPVNFLPG
jgi:hypothetical protein